MSYRGCMNLSVDRKVRYGSAVTVITGLVSWVLVTYVFHHQLPQPLAEALPVIVSAVLGWATAWYTKHEKAVNAR